MSSTKFFMSIVFTRAIHRSVPPKVAVQGNFYVKPPEDLEKSEVYNPEWVPSNGKPPLRIEIVDKNNFARVADFYNYHFTKYTNIRKALDLKFEENKLLAYENVAKAINKPVSLAAFLDDEMVAVKLNKVHTNEEFFDLFKSKVYHPNPKLEIKEDYGEDIRNGPYPVNANRIYIALEECFVQTGKFLPKDITNLGVLIATGIHPDYMGSGLVQYLYAESIKIFKDYGCNYFMGFCANPITYNLCLKIGMQEIFKFPFEEYKENEKQVIDALDDGTTGISGMLGKIDKASEYFCDTNEDGKLRNGRKSYV